MRFPFVVTRWHSAGFLYSVRGVDLTFKIYLLDMATLKRSKALTTGTSQDFQNLVDKRATNSLLFFHWFLNAVVVEN